ncbi:MAG: DUF58 domain-containing protein [Clostridiales bacterium]|nr:DUF58 domain-containing protein [Clostridiales bacterium]
MKFSYIFYKYMVFFLVLIIFGLALSNKVLFSVALLFVLMLMLSLLVSPPYDIEVKRDPDKRNFLTNTVYSNNVYIKIKKGFGLIIFGDLLQEDLELVSGSNYKVVFKWIGEKEVIMTYKIRTVNACTLELKSFYYESHHFLNLLRCEERSINVRQTLTFSPSSVYFKDIRNIAILAKLFNYQFTKSKIGIPTLEFNQLRNYASGDSVKYINWKATARNVDSRGKCYPVVNEFEKEGMYNVWFLLDFSVNMLYGSNIKNVFNYALDTILNLSEYYIKKNANIAFCTFGGNETFLYPNSGINQYYKILRQMKHFSEIKNDYIKLSLSREVGLKETVFKYRNYFSGSGPFFIIFTRIIPGNVKEVLSGVRECTQYVQKNTKRRLPIMVINLNGHVTKTNESDVGEMATDFLRIRDKYIVDKNLKRKVIWIDWDPFTQDFYSILSRKMQEY